MNANVTRLSLSPICSLLDGTDEMCDGYTTCPVCWDGLCPTHSDMQVADGRTDPVHDESVGFLHRACLEFI